MSPHALRHQTGTGLLFLIPVVHSALNGGVVIFVPGTCVLTPQECSVTLLHCLTAFTQGH